MNDTGMKTPLYEEHLALGATFTDFGGWQMPVRYTSDLAEHAAIRDACGLFDISHMAEFFVTGQDAARYLDHCLTGVASEIADGRAKYSLICNAQGQILDDLIVYRFSTESFLIISNAGNRAAVASALFERTAGFDVAVEDASDRLSLIAIQGPKAVEILKDLTLAPLNQLKYYSIHASNVAGKDAFFARTGYTGEDGFELLVSNDDAVHVWRALLAAGAEHGLVASGYAARDTLRLEAGMPLYGHELTLETTPFEAGLTRVVRLDHEFVGSQALSVLANQEPTRRLVGLVGDGRRAARADYELFATENSQSAIGTITSGALSPTLGYPVAMAYVDADFAALDSQLWVDVRGSRQIMTVVSLPFYKRAK